MPWLCQSRSGVPTARHSASTSRPGSQPVRIVSTSAYREVRTNLETAHSFFDELGPVLAPLSHAWGRAWASRLAEACKPLTLTLPDLLPAASCELTLVGVFHREPGAVRFVHEVVARVGPDAVAVEARPSYLPTYRELAAALPKRLLKRLLHMPLDSLEAALEYLGPEDRILWHAALLDANDDLAGGRPGRTTSGSMGRAAAAAVSPSSALTPGKLMEAAAQGELALSDKLAAVVATAEKALPLHGLDVDDDASYAALLSGPLTGQDPAWGRGAQPSPGPRLPGAEPRGLRDSSAISASCHASPAASGGSGSQTPRMGVAEVEAAHRLLALRQLDLGVAAAVGALGPGDSGASEVLAGLVQQCLDQESYLSYLDEADALCRDERLVGAAAAAQHRLLTRMREEHFLHRLQQVGATGGRGRRPCRRLVAVVGRGHAAQLRRALGGGG